MAATKRKPTKVTSKVRAHGADGPSTHKTTIIKKKEDAVRDTRWFLLPPAEEETPSEVHLRIFAIQARMKPAQRARYDMYLYQACLYDDSDIGGLGPGSYESVSFEPSVLSFNVVRQCVDTLTARIAKSRPVPMPLTMGGKWSQQRRAKKYGRFIDGNFDMTNVWQTSPIIARDCSLWGTGLTHNYRVGGRMFHERVFPWEISVDPREAMYGKPRNIYLARYIDRLVLAERYPEFAEKIEQAQGCDDSSDRHGVTANDELVMVLEAWHLASGPNAEDGKHAIVVSNATLEYSDYSRDYFPFSKLQMQEPLMGWFARGLGAQLTGIQYTINDMSQMVQERHALSGGYVCVEDGSEIETDHLDNGSGTILRYTGTLPTWINPQPVNPDSWNFVLSLLPQANNMTGVSQLSAASQLPTGLNGASGKAIEEYDDHEAGRFDVFSKNYENYHIDLAWQQFDLAEDIANDTTLKGAEKRYAVRSVTRIHGNRLVEDLEWKDVRLDRESFVLQVFPTSMLPKTPEGRMAYVQSLANSGWLTPDEAKELLDFPDLERVNNLAQSAYNLVQKLIDRMLDAKDVEDPDAYMAPTSEMNLQLCVVATQQAILHAIVDGCDEEHLGLLRSFVLDAKALLKEASAASAPPAPGPQASAPIPGDAPPPQMSAQNMPPPPVQMAS